MNAFTPDRGRVLVASEERLGAEFEDFDSHFLLEDDGGSTPLATGEGFGPYTLEWFPAAKSGTHLKAAEGLKRAEVLVAMLDYFRGGSAWRESRPWREVEDERPGLLDRARGVPGAEKGLTHRCSGTRPAAEGFWYHRGSRFGGRSAELWR